MDRDPILERQFKLYSEALHMFPKEIELAKKELKRLQESYDYLTGDQGYDDYAGSPAAKELLERIDACSERIKVTIPDAVVSERARRFLIFTALTGKNIFKGPLGILELRLTVIEQLETAEVKNVEDKILEAWRSTEARVVGRSSGSDRGSDIRLDIQKLYK
jgi:hypothetical protein